MKVDEILTCLQAIAIVMAATVFIIKVLAGMFIVNLNLEPVIDRRWLGTGKDVVVVTVRLQKGKTGGTVRLLRAEVRHHPDELATGWETVPLAPIWVMSVEAGASGRDGSSAISGRPLKLPQTSPPCSRAIHGGTRRHMLCRDPRGWVRSLAQQAIRPMARLHGLATSSGRGDGHQ